MSWTLATIGEAKVKAGANANATIIADTTNLNLWADQAEATLSTLTNYDWVTNYASVATNYKPMLADAVSSYVAALIIAYDLSGYPRLLEAQTMIDFHQDRFNKIVAQLKEDFTRKKALS